MKDDARHRQFIPRAATLALVGSFGLFGLLAVAVAAGLLQGFDVSAATAIQRLRYSTTDRLLLALTMTGDGWVMTRATLLAVATTLVWFAACRDVVPSATGGREGTSAAAAAKGPGYLLPEERPDSITLIPPPPAPGDCVLAPPPLEPLVPLL